jgi:tRNA threonylcarbamoyladenosine biosynthesis protein TsaB
MSALALALDTSTPTLSCALVSFDGREVTVLATREAAPPAVTSTLVPGFFDELLAEAGAQLADVRIAIAGTGPGLFTGTRVAVATMKAIAYARRIPLLGAGSLEAMALAAARGRSLAKGERLELGSALDSGHFCAALDARKGELYFGAYRFEGTTPVEILAPEAGPARALSERLGAIGQSMQVFGTGVRAAGAALALPASVTVLPSPLTPGAAEIAFLALQRHPTPVFELAQVLALEPNYLRPPEAEVARKKRETAKS